MNIDKVKLTKALSQIGIFVGKNSIDKTTTLVHFRNENKKAMMFATDLVSAGRTYFDTDEDGLFEFCIEYDQLQQTVRARGKILEASIALDEENEDGEKMSYIKFTDGKSNFKWALRDNGTLKDKEDATAVPTDAKFFDVDAKTLKEAVNEAGFARDEKSTQTPYIMGVNFTGCGSDINIISTDRHRVAGWKNPNSETLDGMDAEKVNAILSPKTIASINLYGDEEKVRLYITSDKVVLVSDSLEAYATKINSNYPNIMAMFDKPIVSSYKINSKEIKESLEIVLFDNDAVTMDFKENKVLVSSRRMSGNGSFNDEFDCERISGGDEKIIIKAKDILDIVKNVSSDHMALSFRNMDNGMKMLSYNTDDGAYGFIAPMKN